MSETKSSTNISPGLRRVAKMAKEHPGWGFTTLAHHIDLDLLREAQRRTRKDGAVGVDGVTSTEYERDLEANLRDLLDRAKSGRYRAPAVRRVLIPKGDGRTRPIGIPTYEDKLLQRAVAMVLEAVYEQDFEDCSYGFRPGRSPHEALADLWGGAMRMGGGWVLEADIRDCFGTLDHAHLRAILHQRIRDGVLLRLIGKWLNAGVLEGGQVSRPESGTPQGGVISPLLANVYLHTVLDVWFAREVKPKLRGQARLIRYADDCAPRRRGKEAERPTGSSLAAWEMRAGPSGSDCRVRVQTTGSCSGPMAGVVSVSEKAGRTRQVCAGKSNASEPLTTCRKRRDVIETGLQLLARDEAQGKPADCLSGDRHGDGVSPAQALVRNVGTFSLDAKGDLQVVAP